MKMLVSKSVADNTIHKKKIILPGIRVYRYSVGTPNSRYHVLFVVLLVPAVLSVIQPQKLRYKSNKNYQKYDI